MNFQINEVFNKFAAVIKSRIVNEPSSCYLLHDNEIDITILKHSILENGFAPIFPDTCYHLTHYWLAAVDIPVASDNPVH
ncbi:hypothetical protein SMA54_19000, partial [Escherichia coli]